jgi:hypothetical protein
MAPYFVISLYDILCELPEPHGARGAVFLWKTLALHAGTIYRETVTKHDILL